MITKFEESLGRLENKMNGITQNIIWLVDAQAKTNAISQQAIARHSLRKRQEGYLGDGGS